VDPGQDITYTITITNGGDGTASGVSVNDPITGAVGAVGTFGFTNCGSSYENSSSGNTVSISNVSVGLASPCVVTFHVSVHTNAAGGSTVTDAVDVSAATEGGNDPAVVHADTLTVATIPDLYVSVDGDDPDNVVVPGQTVTFSVLINNSGNGTAHTSGVISIPSGVGSPSGISFDHCGSPSSSYAAPTLSVSAMTVTTTNDCIISFKVAVSSPNTEGATFVVSGDIAAAIEGGNNPDSVDSPIQTVNVTPNLSTSTFTQNDINGGTLKPGETIGYTVTIKNTGDGTASGVSLTHSVPAHTSFDPSTINVSNCGGTITNNSTTSGLDIVGLQVAVGTNCVITFSGTVLSPLDEGTVIAANATVSAASEGGSGASLSTGDLSIDATPNLSVTFTDNDSDNIVTPGQVVHYTLTVANSGDGGATSSASIAVPSGMGSPTNITFDYCASPSNAYADHVLTLNALKISTTNNCVVTFDLAVSSPNTEGFALTTSADVAAAAEGGNNPASVNADTLTVDVTPHLSVTISDDDTDNTVSLGQVVNTTINITNSGDGNATGVSIDYSATTPATDLGDIQFTNCGSAYSPSHTLHSLNVTGLAVAVGTDCTITFSYSVDSHASDGAHITNTVDTGSAIEGGSNPSPVAGDTLTVDASNTAPNIPADVTSAIFGSHSWLKANDLAGATLSSSLSDPNSGDQVRYRIQLSLDSGFFTDNAIEYLSTLGAQGMRTYTYQENGGTYIVGSASTHLSDGAYYMRIRAEDQKGATSGWYTVPGVAFNYDATPPVVPPAPFLISKDTGRATIGWNATTDANPHPLIPYRIEVSDSPDFSTFNDSDTADLSQLFVGLGTGTHHYFRVYWRDAAGNLSEASSILDVLISEPPSVTPNPSSQSTPSSPSQNSKVAQRSTPTTGQASTTNKSDKLAQTPPPTELSSNGAASSATTEVTIYVRDVNSLPIKGAKVTLHSEPRVGYTDSEGKVIFYGVPIGEHTATVAYKGMVATTPVTLKKGVEELKVTLVMKNVNQKHHWCWLWWLPLLLVIYIGWRYYRRVRNRSKARKVKRSSRDGTAH
jgi:uncharacterized repeat protein (TIGR01451 family)